MHSDYRCRDHGGVPPKRAPVLLDRDHLTPLLRAANVPAWLPWPLPPTWVSAGVQLVGDERTGTCATATAFTGQALTYGPADLVIVSEEPGTGLGGHLADKPGYDPGQAFTSERSTAKVRAEGRFTPLWSLPSEDRSVYVGESNGQWLWMIAWPQIAWSVIHDDLRLLDLRGAGPQVDIPAGAISPRLRG